MGLAKATRTGSFLLSVLALAAILALAGCGDDGGDSGTAATSASAESNSNAGNGTGAGATDGDDAASDGEGQGSKASQPDGKRESGATPEQRRKATTVDIKLKSPGFTSGTALSARYTCDGADESPPLRWSGLPLEAEELILLVLGSRPVGESLFFSWAVAGLDPSLEEIEANGLPSDATLGKNSFGEEAYSICPPKGQGETYVFMLYAIPDALSPESGFDPMVLREEVLDQAGNVGFFIAPYSRG
jgi:phosphatidylethanolamine-binding protein (PEBP) family uncharacterized protein